MTDFDPSALGDEELVAIRDAWEAERPSRWREVIAHKGGEYQRAYDAFMVSRGQAEAAVAEMRRRGMIRRGRRPRSGGPTSPAPAAPLGDFSSSFVTTQSARQLRICSHAHVRFGEKDRTALHAAMSAGIARLRVEEGEILRGAFLGPKPTAGTDVENLVLYNLGLRADTVRYGVAFEHIDERPAEGSVGYEYEPVPIESPFRLWRPGRRLVSWSQAELLGKTAPAVWWSLRRQGQAEDMADDDDDLLVNCRVATPYVLGVTEIKALVDGMLAAAQWMPDPPQIRCELVATALRTVLSAKPEIGDIAAALAGDNKSVLGPCARLIREDGGINPDDHRLVAGAVILQPAPPGQLTATLLDASIFTAEPTSSAGPHEPLTADHTHAAPSRWPPAQP